jgi:hypothetical protein
VKSLHGIERPRVRRFMPAGPPANLFGSLTTNDAPLLLRTHRRPGPWKLRRLDWKDCRAGYRTHAVIGQTAGTISPGLEQTDCIHPLMHWQAHLACTSVEQISPRPRTAIFRDCVIRRLHSSVAALLLEQPLRRRWTRRRWRTPKRSTVFLRNPQSCGKLYAGSCRGWISFRTNLTGRGRANAALFRLRDCSRCGTLSAGARFLSL